MFPGLLLLRLHTDAGNSGGVPVIGHGETYYSPHGVAAILHDWMSRRLLGADACAIESHWRFLYERITAFGGTGAELRALSAIDLALWDVLGQLTNQPVWRLLGGPVRDRIPVYNSCGGPLYGGRRPGDISGQGWPGHGDPGRPGALEDNWRSRHEPADLAEELLAAGYRAMKLWSFDEVYQQHGGTRIDWSDVAQRRSLPYHPGTRGHKHRIDARWPRILRTSGCATNCRGDARYPAVVAGRRLRPDSVEAMVHFRERAGVPIAVSEMVVLRDTLRQVLDRGAADYVMIDPTWVGESVKHGAWRSWHNCSMCPH